MKEYRIVQRTNGNGEKDYIVQVKFCHLIWRTLKEKTELGKYVTTTKYVNITFYSLEDAMDFTEKRMEEERKTQIVETKVIIEY